MLLPHHLEEPRELDCRRALDEYLFAITVAYNIEHRYMFGVSPWKDGTISEYLRQVNMKCASNTFKILEVNKLDPLKIKGQPGPAPPSLWTPRSPEDSERFWARTFRHMFVDGAEKAEGPREFIISPLEGGQRGFSGRGQQQQQQQQPSRPQQGQGRDQEGSEGSGAP